MVIITPPVQNTWNNLECREFLSTIPRDRFSTPGMIYAESVQKDSEYTILSREWHTYWLYGQLLHFAAKLLVFVEAIKSHWRQRPKLADMRRWIIQRRPFGACAGKYFRECEVALGLRSGTCKTFRWKMVLHVEGCSARLRLRLRRRGVSVVIFMPYATCTWVEE